MKYVPWILVAVCCVIIAVQMQCNGGKPKQIIVKERWVDTVYSDTGKVIHDTPKLASSKPIPVPQQYAASDDCYTTKKQFEDLKAQHFVRNIYFNSYSHMGSTIDITDTLTAGQPTGRGIVWNLHYPTVREKETITITEPPRRKVFVGAEVGAAFKLDRMHAGIGLLYENRRENIIGITVGGNNHGEGYGEAKAYFKIGKRR